MKAATDALAAALTQNVRLEKRLARAIELLQQAPRWSDDKQFWYEVVEPFLREAPMPPDGKQP